MESSIKIVIVDDHEMVLQGITALLNSTVGFKVVRTYKSGYELIRDIGRLKIDIVLTDINMPGINGFETAQSIFFLKPNVKVLMFSMEISKAYIGKAHFANISGYISKSAPISEVCKAITTVYRGGKYFELFES